MKHTNKLLRILLLTRDSGRCSDDLPNGFVWKTAHAVKSTLMKIAKPNLNFDHSGRNAFYTVVTHQGPYAVNSAQFALRPEGSLERECPKLDCPRFSAVDCVHRWRTTDQRSNRNPVCDQLRGAVMSAKSFHSLLRRFPADPRPSKRVLTTGWSRPRKRTKTTECRLDPRIEVGSGRTPGIRIGGEGHGTKQKHLSGVV